MTSAGGMDFAIFRILDAPPASETRVLVKLEDEPGGKTRLNVRWTPHNATEVEQKTFDVSDVGMQATWGVTFDQLAAYLARTA